MQLYQLIVPLGISTYVLLVGAAFFGIFRSKFPFKVWFTWHATLGIAALVLGLMHGLLVLLLR